MWPMTELLYRSLSIEALPDIENLSSETTLIFLYQGFARYLPTDTRDTAETNITNTL